MTYFQFNLWQFACWLAEEIISYSSAVMCVALVLSYLTITCPIAFKSSHTCIILIFWEEQNLHIWFQQPDAFTLGQFCLKCGPDHLLKWFE